MDFHQYNERVEVVLEPSRFVQACVAAGAVATAALVAVLPLDLEWIAVAHAWICGAALRAARRLGRRVPIDVRRGGEVAIDGQRGVLRDGSFVAPGLAIVRWRPDSAWLDRTRLVAPDMLPAEEFRRLRVLLRFGQAAGLGPAADGSF
jgi:hypothetical protein